MGSLLFFCFSVPAPCFFWMEAFGFSGLQGISKCRCATSSFLLCLLDRHLYSTAGHLVTKEHPGNIIKKTEKEKLVSWALKQLLLAPLGWKENRKKKKKSYWLVCHVPHCSVSHFHCHLELSSHHFKNENKNKACCYPSDNSKIRLMQRYVHTHSTWDLVGVPPYGPQHQRAKQTGLAEQQEYEGRIADLDFPSFPSSLR